MVTRARRPPVDRSPIGRDGRATYTVQEVAALLGCGRDATYAAANAGQIPGTIRIGRRIVFARGTVLAWLGQDDASSEGSNNR